MKFDADVILSLDACKGSLPVWMPIGYFVCSYSAPCFGSRESSMKPFLEMASLAVSIANLNSASHKERPDVFCH